MASGLQCPGCGHVHPSGLPEIARGDATFRCYGCYRTLSVPEGWSGRPAPRAAPPAPTPAGDAPRGAGTRDARTARLAGRPGRRAAALQGPAPDDAGDATQMVPAAGATGLPDGGAWSAAEAARASRSERSAGVGWSDRAGEGAWSDGGGWPAGGPAGDWRAGTPGGPAVPASGTPLGWVAPRRSGQALSTPIRMLVWAGAFTVGLFVTAFVLKRVGVLDVNTALDIFAGSGARRFGIIVVMLPLWALLSATIAHFSLEALTRRRRPRTPSRRPPTSTSTPS